MSWRELESARGGGYQPSCCFIQQARVPKVASTARLYLPIRMDTAALPPPKAPNSVSGGALKSACMQVVSTGYYKASRNPCNVISKT